MHEVRFLELSLRNFLSFGNNETVIDLTTEGTTLINGENLDVGGANGVGKTTIINAICYVIYNKPFDSISLQRLINNINNDKNVLMEVRLTFQKGESTYQIYRCRGASTNIQITKDDQDITLDSVSANDSFITELIGISYDLFTNVVVFAGGMKPFLEKSISDQRKLIEELFNLTILTEKATKLKEKIKDVETDIKVQEAIVREQTNSQSRYNQQKKDAESRILKWEENRQSQIQAIQDQLKSIESIDLQAERATHELLNKAKQSSLTISQLIKGINTEIKTIESSIKKLQTNLNHLTDSKCPYCLQDYAESAKKKEEVKSELNRLESLLTELEPELTKLIEEESDNKSQLDRLTKSIQVADIKQLEATFANSEILKAKYEELQEQENPHHDAYEQLLLEPQISVNTSKLDQLKFRYEHQQFLLKLLTDKNSFIRKRLTNNLIPFLNRQLNEYTNQLGLPHKVEFKNDMSCQVTELGRELDFGNLSNGEKKRVNLALSLSFRDILHHLHSKINIMLIDEIDGGALDINGIESITKVIKQKSHEDNISVWIISHRPELNSRFDREITVIKENGFSSIRMEA